jgi:hypothetical protein
MTVDGDEAKNFRAVRRDSLMDANLGELTFADDISGKVMYRDVTGATRTLELGPRAIVIIRATYR